MSLWNKAELLRDQMAFGKTGKVPFLVLEKKPSLVDHWGSLEAPSNRFVNPRWRTQWTLSVGLALHRGEGVGQHRVGFLLFLPYKYARGHQWT